MQVVFSAAQTRN